MTIRPRIPHPSMLVLSGFCAVGLAILPATGQAKTIWLCHPARAADPCHEDLAATVVRADGSTGAEPAATHRATVDCFYVYPTVSGQPTVNANLRVDPEQRAIARYQASRFSQACRIFTPMYRQVTLKALLDPEPTPPAAEEKAYRDVRAAWLDYLRHLNRGRGFVLIGHSQGARILTRLIAEEIEDHGKRRRRLVSALLIGGNVYVSARSGARGDFRRVGACRSARQTGCVVAFSAFEEEPPPDALFGRVATALRGDPRAGVKVLCVNPASLAGGRGALRPYVPTSRFPGTLGAIADEPPSAQTPWVTMPGLFSATCHERDGASWLQVERTDDPGDGRSVPAARLGPAWGLHVTEMNLALGNLVDLVRRQAAVYRS